MVDMTTKNNFQFIVQQLFLWLEIKYFAKKNIFYQFILLDKHTIFDMIKNK